jgi:hypothetical protein
VPYLDVNEGALFFGKRGMFTVSGATNPTTLGIGPKLVMKDAIENVDFLATRMHMGVKHGIRGPANQCCTNPIMLMQWHHG